MPEWRTPIERPGSHSVISIRSVKRDRADLGVAHEPGADPAALLADESDLDGVGHPVDVAFDRFEHLPDAIGRCVELDRHA